MVPATKRYPIVSGPAIAAGFFQFNLANAVAPASVTTTDLSDVNVPFGCAIKAFHLDMTILGDSASVYQEVYWALIKNPGTKFTANADLDPQTVSLALGPYVIERGMAVMRVTQLSGIGAVSAIPYHYAGWIRTKRHQKMMQADKFQLIIHSPQAACDVSAAVTFKFR